MWLLDAALAIAMPILAWRVLTVTDLFKAVVLFIATGLLIALGYARLQAPDVALAEAAIGAALTGALFLDLLGSIGPRLEAERDSSSSPDGSVPDHRGTEPHWATPLRLLLGLLIAGLGGVLAWALVTLPAPRGEIARQVEAAMPESGVSHAVTAVLLNFRAYDTLLEIGVLVLAAVAVWSLRLDPTAPGAGAVAEDEPVLVHAAAILIPCMVMVAGYLLWAGAHRPGGAFQAGAVLAAAVELLLLTGLVRAHTLPPAGLGALLMLGFAVFLAVAGGVMATGAPLLTYPAGWEYELILLIETSLTLSIGVILAALFAGALPPRSVSHDTTNEGR